MEVKELTGKLEELKLTQTSTEKEVYKAKIDGKTYSWWELGAAEEFMKKRPVGKKVFCVFTEKENPGFPPFKNIKSLGFPEDYDIPEEEIETEEIKDEVPQNKEKWQEEFNPAFFGMCSNQAALLIKDHNLKGEAFDKAYKTTVKKLYKLNKELIKELQNDTPKQDHI